MPDITRMIELRRTMIWQELVALMGEKGQCILDVDRKN
jgi:hypothetical protein